jgi:hypothetical protein
MKLERGPVQAVAAWGASIVARYVFADEDAPRRIQTGVPFAPLEHAGIEKGEQLL